MTKIINFQKIASLIDSIKSKRKSIVLVGGCFDILHIGHIKFLEEAKKVGAFLIVLLESDENVKKLKGKNRPLFSQKERAQVLSSLSSIDHIILLPPMGNDQDYNQVISQLKPDVIAVTENDPLLAKKRQLAEMVGGKIKIISYLKTFSSSKLAALLRLE